MHGAAIVFGWPLALLSNGAGAAGLMLRRAWLVWTGAVLGSPFLFYLLLTPRFRTAAALALPMYFAAAAALTRGSPRIAWLLFLPMPAITVYVALAVASG